jgi:hypothetical protein
MSTISIKKIQEKSEEKDECPLFFAAVRQVEYPNNLSNQKTFWGEKEK